MKSHNFIALLFCIFAIASCSDASCIQCQNENATPTDIEICEDGDEYVTDSNGDRVPYDEVKDHLEANGFKCN